MPLELKTKVTFLGVVALGGHFPTLDFYEANKFLFHYCQKEKADTFTTFNLIIL